MSFALVLLLTNLEGGEHVCYRSDDDTSSLDFFFPFRPPYFFLNGRPQRYDHKHLDTPRFAPFTAAGYFVAHSDFLKEGTFPS